MKIKITRNGQPLGDAAGADVNSDGYMEVNEERLYKIVSDTNNSEPYNLEFTIKEPGLKAFTFTFE